MAEFINGKVIAAQIRREVEADIVTLSRTAGIRPGLAVVLVGEDPASLTYVSAKAKMCAKLGMHSVVERRPTDISELALLSLIDTLNANRDIHGILVQLPLSDHIDAATVILRIDPRKDVDGLHPLNAGLLATGSPRFIPCTPFGICELLHRSDVPICGSNVVILGRSNLVGRPLSILLSTKGPFGDATVTVCHSRSRDLPAITRGADILIAAIGQREFVHADMVKPGAVVVDVGIHPPRQSGDSMSGDVHFATVSEIASKITPVPGGVGPMTIAMLMRNTTNAAMMAHAPL